MFAGIALVAVLGLARHDLQEKQQPTPATPREECLITWLSPEGAIVHSIAAVRPDTRHGGEIDRDSKIPWPRAWAWDETARQWQEEVLSDVHCWRWTPLRKLWRRARRETLTPARPGGGGA